MLTMFYFLFFFYILYYLGKVIQRCAVGTSSPVAYQLYLREVKPGVFEIKCSCPYMHDKLNDGFFCKHCYAFVLVVGARFCLHRGKVETPPLKPGRSLTVKRRTKKHKKKKQRTPPQIHPPRAYYIPPCIPCNCSLLFVDVASCLLLHRLPRC